MVIKITVEKIVFEFHEINGADIMPALAKSLENLNKSSENLKLSADDAIKVADNANKVADDAKECPLKAKTGIKICVQCGKEYKPTSNAQKRCEDCAIVTTFLKKKQQLNGANKRKRLKKSNKLNPEKEAELESVLNEIELNRKKTYKIG